MVYKFNKKEKQP